MHNLEPDVLNFTNITSFGNMGVVWDKEKIINFELYREAAGLKYRLTLEKCTERFFYKEL